MPSAFAPIPQVPGSPLWNRSAGIAIAVRKNVKRFRGGLVFKAHRLVDHSTLCSRVIKKTDKEDRSRAWPVIHARPFAAVSDGTGGTFLEPFCGHLLPTVDDIFTKLTIEDPHEGPCLGGPSRDLENARVGPRLSLARSLSLPPSLALSVSLSLPLPTSLPPSSLSLSSSTETLLCFPAMRAP